MKKEKQFITKHYNRNLLLNVFTIFFKTHIPNYRETNKKNNF